MHLWAISELRVISEFETNKQYDNCLKAHGHGARIYEALPTQTKTPKQPNQKQQFLDKLPPEFSRGDYIAAAQTLNIPDKTAEKHIAKFVQNGLISRFAHGKYRKP